jgi:hypothetical protein
MRQKLTIDRFEDEKAVLKTEGGETIVWPKKNLPDNPGEGSILVFEIYDSLKQKEEEKDLAKNILNELLNTEKN